MATTLHLRGTMPSQTCCSRRALCFQPVSGQQNLGHIVTSHSLPGSHTLLNGSRGQLPLQINCMNGRVGVPEKHDVEDQASEQTASELTCVMKFGGSSVASADRMREVAELILSFPEERPVIVLSAMGKTTNKLDGVRSKLYVQSKLGLLKLNAGPIMRETTSKMKEVLSVLLLNFKRRRKEHGLKMGQIVRMKTNPWIEDLISSMS